VSTTSVKSDLERLALEIEALKRRVQSSDDPEATTLNKVQELAESVDLKEIAGQAGEFLHRLGRDVKDSKGSALTASFLAGVVVGRMLSK